MTPLLEAYLAAFGFGTSLALGALVLLAITGSMEARWFAAVRPLAEAIAGTLPVYLVLFVPIALGTRSLYGFANGDLAGAPRVWMNPTFFVVRGFVYLSFASLLSEALRRARPETRRRIAAGSLPPLAFVLTFAAFDWLMARSPGFASDMFGLYIFGGAFSGGVGALCLLGAVLPGAMPAGVGPDLRHALGRLLFVGTLLWAYLGFCQFLILWIADIPHEIPFYAARVRGGWLPVSYLLGVGHFAIPFLLLLSRELKRRRALLAAMGGWMVLMHAVDLEWLVVAPTRGPSMVDALVFALFAALLVVVVRLRLVPARADDPAIRLALKYESP
jgi:hypothetical protein